MQLPIAQVMPTLTHEVGASVVQTVNVLGAATGDSDETIGKALAVIIATMPERARAAFDAAMEHYAGVQRVIEGRARRASEN